MDPIFLSSENPLVTVLQGASESGLRNHWSSGIRALLWDCIARCVLSVYRCRDKGATHQSSVLCLKWLGLDWKTVQMDVNR